MPAWLRDIRFGFRMLGKNPETTVIALLAMALAIGATSTIFSAVNAVLVQPLPFEEPERLVSVWQIDPASPDVWRTAAAGQFVDWRRESRSFERVTAARNRSFTLTSFEGPETPLMREAAYGYFEVLGAKPILGRTFRPEEDRPGGDRVVILSHELWQRRFGGDPEVLGRTTQLDGEPFEIVGVMPEDFYNPVFGLVVRPVLWLPMALPEAGLNRRGNGYLVVAKLADGVSIAEAQLEMDGISRNIRDQFPDTNQNIAGFVAPLKEQLVRGARPALLVLLGAVLFVLLVACFNVANLLLTRAMARRREIAVRRALGANLRHLSRQLITETMVLTLIGGTLGLILALWGAGSLGWLIPKGPGMPQFDLSIDRNVLLFTLGISVLTGLVFGLVPILHTFRENLDSSLSTGAVRSTGARGEQRIRNALVVGEVALSLILLIGAGLMIRTFISLERLDPGFDATNVLTFRVSTRGADYQEGGRRVEFFEKVVEGIQTVPGVVSAGAAQGLPFFNFIEAPVIVDAQARPEPGAEPRALVRRTIPGYLDALRVPLLRGRNMTLRDDAEAPQIAVINRTMAEQLWAGQDPLGQALTILDGSEISRIVVGIVADVRSDDNQPEPAPIVYVPMAQDSSPTSMGFVVRTRAHPLSVLEEVKRQVRAVDPAMPVYLVQTLEDVVETLDWRPRFIMSLLGIFAVLALCLAVMGIYAVLSQAVMQRTREIGIRIALGAQTRDVLSMVLRGGLLLAGVGIAMGLIGALGFSNVLKNQLYGVAATDPATYVGLSILLAFVALLSSLFPALRAARVSPVRALREE